MAASSSRSDRRSKTAQGESDEAVSSNACFWNDIFADKPQDKLAVFDWSVSGFETCVVVHGQGFRLALDIGACPPQALSADWVFVSHGHVDHCGSLHLHMRRRQLAGMGPATYYVPEHMVEQLTCIAKLFDELHGDDGGESGGGGDFRGKILPALPGVEIELSKNLRLRPFPTVHRVPSIGCLLLSKRSQLLPEYAGRDSREMNELVRTGVQIRSHTWEPTLAYTGDTRFSIFTCPPDPDLMRVRLLICELTYIEGLTDKAEKFAHCHLHDFSSQATLFGNIGCLYFVHFSRRYDPDKVVKEVLSNLPEALRSKVRCGLNALRFYQCLSNRSA